MFRCIARTKQMGAEEGGARESGTPSRKKGIKNLTIQIKDMVLKLSGAFKKSKSIKGKKGNTGIHSISEGLPSPNTGDESLRPSPYIGDDQSLRSTPAWDFTVSNYHGGGGILTEGGDIVLEDVDIVAQEWKGEVEPGVHITFVSLPNGVNHLKRVRFSQRVFTKLQAQIWWAENYERILDLYKVHRYTENALDTSPASDDELRDASTSSMMTYPRESPKASNKDQTPRSHNKPFGGHEFQFHAGSTSEPSRATTSYADQQRSISDEDCGVVEAEWIDQDEHGIYITITKLPGGRKEL